MNAFALNASSMDAKERNKILDKQKSYMDKLERAADKIRISDQLASKSTVNNIKQDNKQWNIGNVTNNGNDFMFI
jgi:Fe-S cluster assembly scaffold protein SufB